MMIVTGKTRTRRQMMAIGDDNGILFIMEIPKSLSKPLKNEVQICF
jgi:hypothetical protein